MRYNGGHTPGLGWVGTNNEARSAQIETCDLNGPEPLFLQNKKHRFGVTPCDHLGRAPFWEDDDAVRSSRSTFFELEACRLRCFALVSAWLFSHLRTSRVILGLQQNTLFCSPLEMKRTETPKHMIKSEVKQTPFGLNFNQRKVKVTSTSS